VGGDGWGRVPSFGSWSGLVRSKSSYENENESESESESESVSVSVSVSMDLQCGYTVRI
jgi:hypothetical protein